MNDNLFRILAFVILIAGMVISIYHRRRADIQSGERVSLAGEPIILRLLLRLTGMALWLGVFVYLINPRWMSWSQIDLPEWARWLGAGMGVLADLLAYWVLSNLGNNVSPTVRTRSEATLVTSGPYRWVRHPLYTMGMMAYLGFALLSENWFIALMAVIGFVLLVLRTPLEEAGLIEKFGDAYRQYMTRTGRFLPKLG